MSRSRPPADLLAVVDPGFSLGKIVAGFADRYQPLPLLMPPDYLELPYACLQAHHQHAIALQAVPPVADAWLELPTAATPDRPVIMVGELARRFEAIERIDKLKYETAVYKVLAAVGTLAQTYPDTLKQRFSLQLAVLLPYGEYANRTVLAEQLTVALRHYRFRGQSLRVRLQSLHFFPEGSGLVSWYLLQHGATWLQDKTIVALMLGHRNSSVLIFQNHRLRSGHTTQVGFHALLRQVCQQTAGQTPAALAATIYRLKSDLRPDHADLQRVLRSTIAHNREVEAGQLVSAIQAARLTYWHQLQEWLATTLPPTPDGIVLAGGAMLYLYDDFLRPYLGQHTLAWGKELMPELEAALQTSPTPTAQPDVTSFRLLDAYSLYCCLKPTR